MRQIVLSVTLVVSIGGGCVSAMDTIEGSFTRIGKKKELSSTPLLADFYSEYPQLPPEVYVIDEMSFIDQLPEERREFYQPMLDDPGLLLSQFQVFLSLCHFPLKKTEPEIDTFVQLAIVRVLDALFATEGSVGKVFSSVVRDEKQIPDLLGKVKEPFLTRGTITLLIENMITILNKNPFLLKEVERIYTPFCGVLMRVLSATLCNPEIGVALDKVKPILDACFPEVIGLFRRGVVDIFQQAFIGAENRDVEYAQHIFDIVRDSVVADPIYRKILVAFLASVELHKDLKILFGIADEGKFGTGFSPEDDVLSLYLKNSIGSGFDDGGVFALTLPYFVADSHAAVGRLCRSIFTNMYGYTHIHEFGHAIFLLLASNLLALKELDMLEWEQIPLAKALLFPDFNTLKVAKLLPKQESLRPSLMYNLWDNIREILQIAGIYFLNNKIIVNKLSDLDLAVSKGDSISWTHRGVKGGTLFPECNFVPDEALLRILFELHDLDYENYKQKVLQKKDPAT